jgi:hypothetical protein
MAAEAGTPAPTGAGLRTMQWPVTAMSTLALTVCFTVLDISTRKAPDAAGARSTVLMQTHPVVCPSVTWRCRMEVFGAEVIGPRSIEFRPKG